MMCAPVFDADSGADGVPVEFKPVPEISPEKLDRTFANIARRKRLGLPSYGAYLLRQADEDTFNRCIALLATTITSKQKISWQEFKTVRDPLLHNDDNGYGNYVVNDTSVHHQLYGSVGVRILVGSYLNPDVFTGEGDDEERRDTAADLHKNAERDPHAVSAPRIAYETMMTGGDALIFDHTQPHSFDGLEARLSIAYYSRLISNVDSL